MAFRGLHQTRNVFEDGFTSMIANNSDLNTARILDKEGGRLHKYKPLTNTRSRKCLNVQIGHHKCMTLITAHKRVR